MTGVYRTSLLVLLLTLLVACAPREEEDPALAAPHRSPESLAAAGLLRLTELPAGSEWQHLQLSDGGESFGFVCNGRPVGPWTMVYANGRIARQGTYLYGGLEDGLWQAWWPNGRRMMRGSYDRGQRHGIWEQWHENGRPSSRGRYSLDQRMGAWISWNRDGEVEARGNYNAGRPVGRWQYRNQDGELRLVHTHTHPGLDMPRDMNPRTIRPDGFPHIPEDRLSPYRPGGEETGR